MEGRKPDAEGFWPGGMLPIKPLAERVWLCINCDSEGEPVYVFDDDATIEGPCWPDMFVEVAGSFAEFLQNFIDSGGEWPTRPEFDDRLWVEYRGSRFRLSRMYADPNDYKNDPEKIDPAETDRVERAVVAATYPSRRQMEEAIGELRFPGCSLAQHESPKQGATQLALFAVQIPRVEKVRVIVYRVVGRQPARSSFSLRLYLRPACQGTANGAVGKSNIPGEVADTRACRGCFKSGRHTPCAVACLRSHVLQAVRWK